VFVADAETEIMEEEQWAAEEFVGDPEQATILAYLNTARDRRIGAQVLEEINDAIFGRIA
jgi:hypothetical protein